jgi:hypothetical protein
MKSKYNTIKIKPRLLSILLAVILALPTIAVTTPTTINASVNNNSSLKSVSGQTIKKGSTLYTLAEGVVLYKTKKAIKSVSKISSFAAKVTVLQTSNAKESRVQILYQDDKVKVSGYANKNALSKEKPATITYTPISKLTWLLLEGKSITFYSDAPGKGQKSILKNSSDGNLKITVTKKLETYKGGSKLAKNWYWGTYTYKYKDKNNKKHEITYEGFFKWNSKTIDKSNQDAYTLDGLFDKSIGSTD